MFFAPAPLFLSLATDPAPPSTPSAEPASLATRLAAAAPQERRYGYAWNPSWTVSLGAYQMDSEFDTFLAGASDVDQDLGLAAEVVIYNWEGERGIGLEFGLARATSTVSSSGVGTDYDVESYRLSLGVRLADRGSDDPFWIPFARAGVNYQRDDSSGPGDADGFGWYVGGGVDFRLGSSFALTPSLIYGENQANNTTEWMFGLLGTLAF
jgi:hypothetical protein